MSIDNNDITNIITEIIDTAKGIFRGTQVILILFGSYARGDTDIESDIDIMLLIDMKCEEIKGLYDVFDVLASKLSLKYEKTVSIQLKDKLTFDKYVDALPFYKNVWNEGIKYNVG